MPSGLGVIEKINLQSNMITNLSSIVFYAESFNGKTPPTDPIPSKIPIENCALTHFNMSDNRLESFPYYVLHRMEKLKKLDLGRNNIVKLFDDQEQKDLQVIIQQQAPERKRQLKKSPLSIFTQLTMLNLSSNGMTDFPEELNTLSSLKELNLMNNNIEIIP